MDPFLWQRLHGSSTHLPIVLLPLSVLLDLVALRARGTALAPGFRLAALGTAAISLLGAAGAVVAGLMMTRGELLGSGAEKMHHIFVWPAFFLSGALVIVRLSLRNRLPQRAFALYLGGMTLASCLMLGAGYWGGELLLHAETGGTPSSPSGEAQAEQVCVGKGHDLFLMNCAHCHGEDAQGTGEGPDLTKFRRSDARIANVVQNGIKGQMPRFVEKLNQNDVKALSCFLRSVQSSRPR